jgi:hypothetical protein
MAKREADVTPQDTTSFSNTFCITPQTTRPITNHHHPSHSHQHTFLLALVASGLLQDAKI